MNNNLILTLNWSKYITPSASCFNFSLGKNNYLNFIPGQYFTFHLEFAEKILNRCYSIASPGTSPSNSFEFIVSNVKDSISNKLLFNLKEGARLYASGPEGDLVLHDEHPRRYILVATGTGIAPYHAMLPALENKLKYDKRLEVILLYGVRTPADLIYINDFINLYKKNPRFNFFISYSRYNSECLKHYEKNGYVTNIFKELNLIPNDDIIYLCGNPNMVRDAIVILSELGFSKNNIRFEKYLYANLITTHT